MRWLLQGYSKLACYAVIFVKLPTLRSPVQIEFRNYSMHLHWSALLSAGICGGLI